MPVSRGSSKARYIHKRKKAPWLFDKRSLRTISTGNRGVKRVIGCPRGHWHPRRPKGKQCDVGTQTQAVLIPKKR